MRQVGIFAAAGLFALDHNVERLAEDHANARRIADRVAESRYVELDPASVRTNILLIRLIADGPDAADVVARARELGVLIYAFSPRSIRAVTHLDVTTTQCERAGMLLAQAIEEAA